ncbi:hypothetical protein HU200_026369 [Digitaria exilis]|uniref:KIB1-4 beta-propeller domain-containing protein n=1 Tax=Digitaria exilis TaxID=1010633 RepID=A0A835EUJ3_9POAL|nr:hypothetical protein HU200_026369 [Digitaria exilis]
MAAWSSGLPEGFPAAVLGRLPSHADRVRFAAVCPPWRAPARHHQHRTPPPLPWLALPDGNLFSFPGSSSFRFPAAARYHGSCDDWLLFDRDDDDDEDGNGGYVLHNPFSGDAMRLPSLSRVRYVVSHGVGPSGATTPGLTDDDERAPRETSLRKMVICPGGLVAAIVGREYFAKLALCTMDTFSWSLSVHDRWRWYEDIVFSDGKVYALTGDEDLLAFDVGIDTDTGNAVVFHVKRVVKRQLPRHSSAKVRYLVRSSRGELLMVRRHFSLSGETTVRFSLFRAELRSSRWLEDESCVPLWAERIRRDVPGYHAGVYDMRDELITDILPRQPWCDSPAPTTTWLFRDADGLDGGYNE